MNKILIIAAHPDDEVLGCFGTVAHLIKEGAEGYTLILGEGITSRTRPIENYKAFEKQEEALINLRKNAIEANKIIGITYVGILPCPDNKFDSIPLLEIVKMIEPQIEQIKPNIIFTHFRNDLNIDHRITYQAVITATRPMKDCPVREIYSFEIPSSTEWNFPISFSPNVFFDVKDTLHYKIQAMQIYSGELREYPHPRSQSGITQLASLRGMQSGYSLAEAFEAVRVLR